MNSPNLHLSFGDSAPSTVALDGFSDEAITAVETFVSLIRLLEQGRHDDAEPLRTELTQLIFRVWWRSASSTEEVE
jgi:hypothetical protein